MKETVYQRIRRIRTDKGMTQLDLAKKVGYSGKDMVSRVESGQIDISRNRLIQFADALGVSPRYLLDGSGQAGDDYVHIFSRRLRYYINIKGTTQEQVAEYVGVSPATVSFWCSGARVPRMDKVDNLCKFFDCSADDLLTDSHPDLSSDEWDVIEWYRSTSDQEKDDLRRMMYRKAVVL